MWLDSFQVSAQRSIPKPPFWLKAQAQLVYHRFREPQRLKAYEQEAEQIIELQKTFSEQTSAALNAELDQFRHRVRLHRLEQDRPAVRTLLALLREVSRRTLGMEPYGVQLMAVLGMLDGYVVQLAPGEGKTLTIGVLAVIFGWSREPCHILTSNDYLAERDVGELQAFFECCGVRVCPVLQHMSQDERREAYQAPVVYTTAKQLLADYLTDQIQFNGPVNPGALTLKSLQKGTAQQLLMRGIHTAVVDEADNILIDEAITPMIISGKDENQTLHQAIDGAKKIVDLLAPIAHYHLDAQHREVRFTAAGEEKVAQEAERLPLVWRGKAWREDLVQQAVLARDYFTLDQHYVVLEDEIVIVDEGTGRPMPGRSWSYGLHQAVEARAGVPLTHPNKTMARMSFQNFFKHFVRLSGASGTLQNVAFELFHNYQTLTLRVPSRLSSQLRIDPFWIYPDKAAKTQQLLQRMQRLRAQGIPVLLGTRNIDDSELVAEAFTEAHIPYQLLNAKKLDLEAQIIQHAGEPGQVTIATNMAGRGTDIKLTAAVQALGGLRVIMFEPHESARVDWQLFGRAGRQGNPGQVYPMAAWTDQLLERHIPKLILRGCRVWLQNRQPSVLATLLVRFAQRRAQAKAFGLRKFMNAATERHQQRMSFIRED